MKKGCITVAILALVALVLLLTFALESNTPTPVTLPTPNAYDVLVAAGSQIVDMPDDYAETEDTTRLASFLEKNSQALNSLDNIHKLDCVVVYDRSAGLDAVLAKTMPESSSIRQAMRLLFAQARLAELQGNQTEAAKRYAKLFAIATKSANQGLLVDNLQSMAIERQALNQLANIVEKLSGDEKLEVLAIIETSNRGPRDLDAIVDREHNLVRNQHGRLSGNWMIRLTKSSQQEQHERFRQTDEGIVRLLKFVIDETKRQ